jgi:hypothetical protein
VWGVPTFLPYPPPEAAVEEEELNSYRIIVCGLFSGQIKIEIYKEVIHGYKSR